MSAPLSRAWVVCRVLDDAANDRRERSVARALALSADTRENPHNSWLRRTTAEHQCDILAPEISGAGDASTPPHRGRTYRTGEADGR